MKRSLSGDLTLTKLQHFLRDFVDSKGNTFKCLCLPIERNHFKFTDESIVRMPVKVIVRDEEDQYKQHGFVAQQVDSKTYMDADEEEKMKFQKLPILGNLRDFNSSSDTSGRMDEPTDIDAESNDDLPY